MEYKRRYSGGIYWRLRKHAAVIEKHLNPGEEVLYALYVSEDSILSIIIFLSVNNILATNRIHEKEIRFFKYNAHGERPHQANYFEYQLIGAFSMGTFCVLINQSSSLLEPSLQYGSIPIWSGALRRLLFPHVFSELTDQVAGA